MEIKYKSGCKAYVKSPEDGTIEAIVSVFGNIDSYNERVMPGAFTKSLETKLPKGVWAHNWEQPIAKTLSAEELLPGDPGLPEAIRENGGLKITAKFNLNTQRGREAYSDIKEGIIDEFSIGYFTIGDNIAEDGVRDLTEISLHEWSPVLVGANPATAILSVKSAMSYDDDCEALVADVKRFIDRSKVRQEMRVKEGRVLSARNITRLTTFIETVRTGLTDLEEMLTSASSTPKALELRQRQLKLKLEQIRKNTQ